MWWHRLHKVLNDFIWDERVAEVEFCDIGLQIHQLARVLSNLLRISSGCGGTYLAVRNFAKALKDLLWSMLIFRYADHEADELFKANASILR
jgi:hypothetical protein